MKISSCLQPHHANAPLRMNCFKMERCCLALFLRIIVCHLLTRCSPNIIKQGAKQAMQAKRAKRAKQAKQTWRTCENMKLCSPLQPHAAKAPLQSAPFKNNAAVCCFFTSNTTSAPFSILSQPLHFTAGRRDGSVMRTST